jgi:trk system potassium uptake protein TrkH
VGTQAAALRYSVRFGVLFKYFGQLCLVVAALSLVPAVVSLLFEDFYISLRYAAVILFLAGLGAGLGRLQSSARIQVNEAMVLVAFLFFFTPLMMSIPMMAAGLSFADALFEAISGATTTGLSMVKALDRMPASFLFLRAWMQWYGGLGIVVLSLALVLQPGTTAKDLAVTESRDDDLVGGAKARARKTFWIYSLMTAGSIAMLMLLGVGPFQAVLYAMAAVSTGGFAPHAGSLAALKAWTAQVAVIVICVAGALPLISYHRWFRRSRPRRIDLHHVGTLIGCGLLLTFLVGFFTWRSSGRFEPDKLYHVPLLVFSAQTTAGFSSQDPAKLGAASKLALIAAMMIGGSPGSTAGGFKLMRLVLALQLVYMLILKSSLARHAVVSPQLWGRRLTPGDIQEAVSIILLFLAVVGISWLFFVAAGYDPLDSLFEVTSATGTVGLSVGITRADLPVLLKGVLGADMLLGRLEMIAWLVFLYPRTWFGRRRS